jgi:hypothetical protein
MFLINQQVALMRQLWPGFQVRGKASWMVTWEGRLRPFHQSYLVKVFYCIGRDLDSAEILPVRPRVTVLEPLLTRRPEDPDETIPHHYPNRTDPEHPVLCLFDPREREWQHGDPIAETTLPWAVNWLACYEGWQATGEWTGGGRHPTIEEITAWEMTTHQNDQPAHFNAAAFNRLGRRIGTFASFPLMAAASVESSRLLSWRDWRNATLAESRWRDISTSSPELRPAGLSPLVSLPALPVPRCQTSISGAAVKSSRRLEAGSLAELDAA